MPFIKEKNAQLDELETLLQEVIDTLKNRHIDTYLWWLLLAHKSNKAVALMHDLELQNI